MGYATGNPCPKLTQQYGSGVLKARSDARPHHAGAHCNIADPLLMNAFRMQALAKPAHQYRSNSSCK
jgi:hypothetical protein